MDPPGITRHRRPFLAPVWLTLVAALVIGGVAVAFYRSATTTVVLLVPPVEKEPRTCARAAARAFGAADGGGRRDALYVCAARRARARAGPLARSRRPTPRAY